MFRPIWTLPLSQSSIQKLKAQGFNCCEDLIDLPNGSEYFSGLLETEEEIREMLKHPKPKIASEMAEERDCIATFCKGIDELLNGGVQVGKLTELTGAPGSGRSQLCMQLCVSVQIPACFEGLEAEAIYIDTNSNFSHVRLTEMIEAFQEHVSRVLTGSNMFKGSKTELLNTLTTTKMFEKVHVIKMNDLNQLYALYDLIKQYSKVKLIIVDSFVMPLYKLDNSLKKNSIVHNALDILITIAQKHNVAVVLTNDLTTMINDKETMVFPALGETFAHRMHYRLLLSKTPNNPNSYTAFLKKSVEQAPTAANFQITTAGVRDIHS
ncbi:DNA repair protein RAD51 homolog 3-like isoform X1 [Daktulosphaira vitifoliae]|uniref:DNA repair protein RAD51 homolog 3-like isoform X1 n=1 Tax=Daktulosphaira vitifoliae TaxID=58002 RepID=UPI0021A9976A|nr:DNA repair protein RAD51 homolog 3-like isoform X1 [Daktulosphaira vitifoliae]XP_050523668.1 DNA repair protein RAD51 homolog 3-like isoform X1 [Daktulosphaira vitifoliae]XP_050523669.1 DNA repair protein RAD51 homolog 3-like isoform X1 [Daktulosphaira vitifoliae]